MRIPEVLSSVVWTGLFVVGVAAQNFDCNPCIERENYKVKAIYHGVKSSAFWQEVEAAAIQSGKDLGVQLDITLYDTFDPTVMASDIKAIAESTDRPDSLIVSVPALEVAEAVKEAVDAGIPVFGLNSGYELAVSLGVRGWVAQDEYLAGVEAASAFMKALAVENATSSSHKALFVNHEEGNVGLEARFQGYSGTLLEELGVEVESAVVDGSLDTTVLSSELTPYFANCSYDVILLASSSLYGAVADLMEECAGQTLLGSFDSSAAVFSAISDGTVLFTVTQNQYLQGVIPVLLASIYATTAKIPAPPSETEFGTYLSGPSLVTIDNVPNSERQVCEGDAFPICPNTSAPGDRGESDCACTDRSKIKIGGVLHGVRTDTFWDSVFAAAQTAADDMGVELDLDRFEPQATDEVLHLKMERKIRSLCDEGVDGIFITIPSDSLNLAIQRCLDAGIPVISVNAGVNTAKALGLMHHIGQLEFNSGFAAANELIANGVTKGWCLNHEAGTQTTVERCDGMEAAFAEMEGVEYMGQIIVPRDNDVQYSLAVESFIGDDGDWDGFGFLLLGQLQIPPAATLLEEHPKVRMATYDLSDLVFEGLKAGDILFGIDQQPYLQGYLPVPLLTYLAYSRQRLANKVIESGPSFVLNAPTEEQQICEANFYKVCDGTESSPGDIGVAESSQSSAGFSMLQYMSNNAQLFFLGTMSLLYIFG